MHRAKWIALVSAIALAVILITWRFSLYQQAGRGYGHVAKGSSRADVLRLMGHPWKEEGCGAYLGEAAPGCSVEFVYAHPFAPLAREYWVVQFGYDHRVVGQAHLVSP